MKNAHLAEKARKALDSVYAGELDNLEDDIVDLLTNIAHLCEQQTSIEFDSAVAMARSQFYSDKGCYNSLDSVSDMGDPESSPI